MPLFRLHWLLLMELIDTLWNVNIAKFVMIVTPVGINRYIMECKYGCTLLTRR